MADVQKWTYDGIIMAGIQKWTYDNIIMVDVQKWFLWWHNYGWCTEINLQWHNYGWCPEMHLWWHIADPQKWTYDGIIMVDVQK